jgi:23S rRNA (cytosine1962-C5)-methyltransferase
VYELVDAGNGRKLERFGSFLVARPAPAVITPARDPGAWEDLQAEYVPAERRPGMWCVERPFPEPWHVHLAGSVHELRATPSGQVGVFPEQTPLREWMAERIGLAVAMGRQPRVLDLFAYTGGTTLAAARAGAAVTTVDASKSAIAWTRRNLELNDLAAAPVRTIQEDAVKFVRRAVQRGERYDAVALDPPTFGRGPAGETWTLTGGLDDLLGDIASLLTEDALFVVITAHAQGWTPARLARALDGALGARLGRTDQARLDLKATSGAVLPAGLFARRELA